MTYARSPRPDTKSPLFEADPSPWRRRLRDVLLWLAGKVQGHPIWPYPLEHFYALEDRPSRCYVWTLHPEYTEDEAAALAESFNSAFIRRSNREPRALHVFTPHVDVLRRLDKEDAERHIIPWLKQEQ